MIEYLREFGTQSFLKRPFCDADSMVLSQLSYFKFDGILDVSDRVSLRELNTPGTLSRMFEDPKYARNNRALYEALIYSARFRSLEISHYVSITDKDAQTQFCAMILSVPDGPDYVAYRGTDETMVGWKEDFNLTYMTEIPAQREACKYLAEAADILPGRFYAGGHSKGGHLAVYASMHADRSIQDRLINIYCLDGPGFMKSMLEEEGYHRIRDRIIKLLPQSSLIGMLQERDDNYKVIGSTGVGLLQHNLYTWKIEHGELVEEELKDSARIIDRTVNDWIEGLDPDSRQKFVDTLYDIVTSCEADNRVDFMANFMSNSGKIIDTLKGLDPETSMMLKKIMNMLLQSAAIHFREEIGKNVLSGQNSVVQRNGSRRTAKNSRSD